MAQDSTSSRFKNKSLRRNVKRFRGGLVFKAHRLVYHSALGLRVIKKKKKTYTLISEPLILKPQTLSRRRLEVGHIALAPRFFSHPSTNPHGTLKSTIFAVRFLGENITIPSVFSRESKTENSRFERPARVTGVPRTQPACLHQPQGSYRTVDYEGFVGAGFRSAM